LKEKPKANNKGFELVLKEKEKKFLFGGSSTKKEIHIQDKKTVEVSTELFFLNCLSKCRVVYLELLKLVQSCPS
jgi:hypothetical protein